MTSLSLSTMSVGFPGTGKAKIGHPATQSLGVARIDTDRLIEGEMGCSISTIFAQEGEVGFRKHETRAVERAPKMKATISSGGGAITSPRVRELFENVDVVRIEVEYEELLRRVTKKNHRPLLREDSDGVLLRLRKERESYYREIETVILPSDDDPALKVTEHLLGFIDTHRSTIHIKGSVPYGVLITRGIIIEAILETLCPQVTRVLLAHASPVEEAAREVTEGLHTQGLETHLASHPEGEVAKSPNVIAGPWDLIGQITLRRADTFITTGGGVITDMTDFVAAAWLRGIDLVVISTILPTTADAATGGKTGINMAVGKDLVDSFHPPRRVPCDLDFPSGFPGRNPQAGMAKVLKCGSISDKEILTVVEEAEPDILTDPASPELRELLERVIGVKAWAVSEDLKESGLCEILNCGHTFAHAIEHCEDYTWRHGETVAIGRIFAVHLTQLWGLLSQENVARCIRVLSKMGFPTSYGGATFGGLKDVIASDEKARQGRIRFVFLEGIARPKTFQVGPSELDEPAEWIGVHS